MQNDEREVIICCAQALLELPAKAKTRDTLTMIANALAVIAVADSAEREIITDGRYQDTDHIRLLMGHIGLRRAKEWVSWMLSRPETGYGDSRGRKGRSLFKDEAG